MFSVIKICAKCKKEKSIEEFYKNKTRPDGYSYWCKDCERIQYRIRNKEHNYAERKHKKYYRIHKDEISKRRKLVYERDKYKLIAHEKVRSALNKGHIVRKPCEVCGESKSEAHHDNYNEPLNIRWLCRTHHARHHFGKD